MEYDNLITANIIINTIFCYHLHWSSLLLISLLFYVSLLEFQKNSKKPKKRRRERKVELSDCLKTQCLFTLPFKQLNLCLGSNICSSSLVILRWRACKPDHKGSNASEMTRKKRKKAVQQKSIHEFVTKGTLTSPATQSNHGNQKPEWCTSTLHPNRFQCHFHS